MIYLYSGTPGSGKSLHTADMLYHKIKFRNAPVIANFDFAASRIRKNHNFYHYSNDEITPDLLITFSKEWFSDHRFKEGDIVLVIDEAQILFNAREWNKKGRSDWLSFFTQHRKYGYDIILIAQFDKMLDSQIRALIEYEYIHRKVSNFGIWGKLLSLGAGGKLFVCVQMWYPLRERIGSEFFKARKKYYNLYDSYLDFSSNG